MTTVSLGYKPLTVGVLTLLTMSSPSGSIPLAGNPARCCLTQPRGCWSHAPWTWCMCSDSPEHWQLLSLQMKQPLTTFFIDFMTILPHAYSSWRRMFLYLKLIFLFVLGGFKIFFFLFWVSQTLCLRFDARESKTFVHMQKFSLDCENIHFFEALFKSCQ